MPRSVITLRTNREIACSNHGPPDALRVFNRSMVNYINYDKQFSVWSTGALARIVDMMAVVGFEHIVHRIDGVEFESNLTRPTH